MYIADLLDNMRLISMLILQAAHVEKDAWKAAKTIYEFSAKDIDGNNVSLDRYKSV